nr:hypothetical protein [Tanacetum cinerariifolium]
VDIAFKYRTFFLDDDEELEHIKRTLHQPSLKSYQGLISSYNILKKDDHVGN